MFLGNSLEEASNFTNVTASAFCRRRLPVMLVKLNFCESISQAVKLVEQGQVAIGPDLVGIKIHILIRS